MRWCEKARQSTNNISKTHELIRKKFFNLLYRKAGHVSVHCAHSPNIPLAFEHLPMLCIALSRNKQGEKRQTKNQKQKQKTFKNKIKWYKNREIAAVELLTNEHLNIEHCSIAKIVLVDCASGVEFHLHPFLSHPFFLLFSCSIGWIQTHITTKTNKFIRLFSFSFSLSFPLNFYLQSIPHLSHFLYLSIKSASLNGNTEHTIQTNIFIIIRSPESKNESAFEPSIQSNTKLIYTLHKSILLPFFDRISNELNP